ncbi:MAG TPA: hypothetical protein VGM88_18830 [Kofleriaceae bacterium]
MTQDAFEQATVRPPLPRDEAARASYEGEFRRGWQEVTEDVEKDDRANPSHKAPFMDGHGTRTPIEGAQPGNAKQLGDGGYGARLLDASATAALANADEWGLMAVPSAPVTDVLAAALEAQAESAGRNTGNEYEGLGSEDPSWVRERKDYSIAWATENIATIQRYQYEQARICHAFDTWVPLANASHAAMAELVETAKVMGFDVSRDKDSVRWIKDVERELDAATKLIDAKVIGAHGHTSWSTRLDDPAAISHAQPELHGESLEPRLDGITEAMRSVQVAYNGVYQVLVAERGQRLRAERGKLTAEVSEIDELIEFWSQLGEAGERAYHKGSKADAVIDRQVASGAHHANQEINAAYRSAADEARNPKDDQAHAETNAHIKGFEDYHDTWGEASAESGEKLELPEISIGGVLKSGLHLLYQERLEELRSRIGYTDAKEGGNTRHSTWGATQSACDALQIALEAFDRREKAIGPSSLRDREQDVVSFGHELDSYAIEHRTPLQGNGETDLVPPPGGERYATALACVAKIEKYRSVSKLALQAFDFNDMINVTRAMDAERGRVRTPAESVGRTTARALHPPPPLPPMSEAERSAYEHIGGTYLHVLQHDTSWSVRLAGVETKFAALNLKASGYANVKHATGRKF